MNDSATLGRATSGRNYPQLLAALALLALSGCAVSTHEARIAFLENRMDYAYEVLRGRHVSDPRCSAFTDAGMDCHYDSEGMNCSCKFKPDEQDAKNEELFEETKRKAAESAPAQPDEPVHDEHP